MKIWKSLKAYGVLLTVLALGAAVLAQSGVQQYGELQIAVTEEGIDVPDGVTQGYYSLNVDLAAANPESEIALDRLNEGSTVEDAVAAYDRLNQAFMGEGDPASAIQNLTEVLTAVTGWTGTPTVVQIVPGEYMVSVNGPAGFDYATFTVTGEGEAAETEAPDVDLVVDMMEFAFSIPDEVPAGQQIWEVRNVGEQVHHMILMRVLDGYTVDDVMAFLQTEEGEPPVEEVGYTAVLSPEVSNYLEYNLTPGSYVAICFLPDYETGQPHVALGMIDTFTVAGN